MRRKVLVLLLMMLFVGCSKDIEPKEYNTGMVLEVDEIEVEVVSVTRDSTVRSFLEYGTYMEISDDEYEYVDVVMILTNKSTEEVRISNYNFSLSGDNIKSETVVYSEGYNLKGLTKEDTISQNSNRRFHVLVPVKKDSDFSKVFLNFESNDERFKYQLEVGGYSETAREVAINETLTSNNTTLEVLTIEKKDSLFPTNIIGGDVHYIVPKKEGYKLLCLEVKVTNNSSEVITLDELFGLKNIDKDFNDVFTWYAINDSNTEYIEHETIESNVEMTYILTTSVKEYAEMNKFVGHYFQEIIEINK